MKVWIDQHVLRLWFSRLCKKRNFSWQLNWWMIDCLRYRNSTIAMGMQRKLHTIYTHLHTVQICPFYTHRTSTTLQVLPLGTFQICWVVRTWEDLELVINPYKVGPAEMLTWRVWPYVSAKKAFCARHNSVRRNILWHFLLTSIALEHRHRPIFPLNMGLFFVVTPLQWHSAGQQRCFCPWFHRRHHGGAGRLLGDYFYHCDSEDVFFVRQNKTMICRICYLLLIYLYHRPSTHIIRISTQIILHGETLWCCDTSLFSCRVT